MDRFKGYASGQAPEIKIVTSDARADPDNLARELLDEMQSFFADPANEAEFQEWKRDRDRETA